MTRKSSHVCSILVILPSESSKVRSIFVLPSAWNSTVPSILHPAKRKATSPTRAAMKREGRLVRAVIFESPQLPERDRHSKSTGKPMQADRANTSLAPRTAWRRNCPRRRAKCRSVYAFRQVWRFMQESRGRFNPWEPPRPLPTILWPSRFRVALTRETSPRQSRTGHFRTGPPRHALSGSPATLSTLLLLRPPPLTIYEKRTTAKLSSLMPPRVHNMGKDALLRHAALGRRPVSTIQGRDLCLSGDSVAGPVSATRCKVLDGTRHSRIQKKRGTQSRPSNRNRAQQVSLCALCTVVSPIGAGQGPARKPRLLRVFCVRL